MYTSVWNVIMSILRSQNHFHSIEIHLGSQDYISNWCVHPLFKWDLYSDGVKLVDKHQYNICKLFLSDTYHMISVQDPCSPNPCGSNAICKKHETFERVATCYCIPGYSGDPFWSCQPEWILFVK